MNSDSEPLVVVTPNGLYCPPGDFYVDPWRPEDSAGNPEKRQLRDDRGAAEGIPRSANGATRDAGQPVQTAVITHGHGDHLRHGSARYILARPGAGIARQRLGGDRGITPVEY